MSRIGTLECWLGSIAQLGGGRETKRLPTSKISISPIETTSLCTVLQLAPPSAGSWRYLAAGIILRSGCVWWSRERFLNSVRKLLYECIEVLVVGYYWLQKRFGSFWSYVLLIRCPSIDERCGSATTLPKKPSITIYLRSENLSWYVFAADFVCSVSCVVQRAPLMSWYFCVWYTLLHVRFAISTFV